MPPVIIRSAVAAETPQLSVLALRSKAHWGYPAEFIDSCRAELTVTPDSLGKDGSCCFVAESEGTLSGFGAVQRVSTAVWELDALFVEPCRIGTGIGRALMDHAKSVVLERGGTDLTIQGDPHAESFYIAAGAVRIGARESGSVPGRMLPLFQITLTR